MKPLYGDADDIRERAQHGEELARYAAQHGESTTKPIAESGWTEEWPTEADAFYWIRRAGGRYRDLPGHVDRDRAIGLFDHSYSPRGDCEGELLFLGPISPSDFEQLIQLRKALPRLIERFEREYRDLTDGQFGSVEDFPETRAIRDALGVKGRGK